MATQKDLDVLKQKLSDLDVKLRSMGGGSAKRNPRFDLEMANQNYANFMRDQQARLAAERGQYTQGRLMGAPEAAPLKFDRPRPVAPIPPPEQGQFGAVPPTQERLKELEIFNKMRRGEKLTPEEIQQNKILERKQIPIPPPERGGSLRPNGMPMAPMLPADQMQSYNNYLQQGIQNSNTMNQNGMANFASIQPGMPLADRGMQQPRATPAPKKFSTVNTPSIRFG